MNLAANAAKSGAPVAFFSLEMSSNEITQRLLAAEAGLALSRMRNGQLTEGDWSQLIQASSDLSNCELYVDDSAGLSIVELRTKARRMMRNKKNGLIIVDYLQLMQPVTPIPNNRAVEVAEISRGLKVLAKELEVPLFRSHSFLVVLSRVPTSARCFPTFANRAPLNRTPTSLCSSTEAPRRLRPNRTAAPIGVRRSLLWRRIVVARRAISRLRSSLNSPSSLITSTIRGTSLMRGRLG